jgi:anionic cell wall polymer biosynthesis LytR-Cps2A-Psr (LCP) family protein
MKTLKKIFRVIVLALLILLALSGIGIVGAFFNSNRERYLNKNVTIEMVDKKKKETTDVIKQ